MCESDKESNPDEEPIELSCKDCHNREKCEKKKPKKKPTTSTVDGGEETTQGKNIP